MKKIFFIISLIILFSSCEILQQFITANSAPTEAETVDGLKTALNLGVDFAVANLNKKDGYYKNKILKIQLPEEVNNVVNIALQNKTVQALGFDKILQTKIDNFVMAVNRSAEEAAKDAKPIFVETIKNLSISDGIGILQGKDISGKINGFDSIAATHYLELKTRKQLFNLYQPKINLILDKDLGLGFSTNKAWDEVIKYYNGIVAPILQKEKITFTLSDYATNKALDGCFYMIGKEEKKIRKDPFKYAVEIIKKVFGSVYK